MICSACQAENDDQSEACFTCGKALGTLTQGTVLASRYDIVSPLGRGGMGRVYKAFDRVLEEAVALKVLRSEFVREPEMARRFLSEIKLARKVSHPNVCRIHEYGEDGELRYISMELIEGVSLKEYLRQQPLTLGEAFEVALGAARGLQAVHERGIIHRDFKTSNIMVDRRGRVRLLDFGIARVAGAQTGTFTAAGQVIGTPESMSPEQALGAQLDFRSDIYALGCVVFEIFCGQAVFQGETPLVTLFKHLHEAPPLDAPWSTLPAPLVQPLRTALAKDPADRFETVAQFVEALEAARPRVEGAGPTELRPPRLEGPAAAANPPETATVVRPGSKPSHTVPYTAAPRDRRWVGPALAVAAAAALAALLVWPRVRPVESVAGPAGSEPIVERPAGGPSPLITPTAPAPEVRADPSSGAATPAAAGAASPVPAAGPPANGGAPPGRRVSAGATSTATPVPRGTVAPRAALTTGTLSLLIVPPAEVILDGASLGTVSARSVSLPVGQHAVRVLHPEWLPWQRKITIERGITFELVLDLAERGIRRPR